MPDKIILLFTYAAYFITTILLSFLINGLFLKFASTLGTRNMPENIIRWSPQAKPSLGGISFFILFLLSIASYPILFVGQGGLFDKQLFGLLSACTLAFLMGLSDDAYNTKPVLKLAVQIMCALILIFTGTSISMFEFEYTNYALTIFWIVSIMNSINMLDNMDAITSIISITVIINALLVLLLKEDTYNVHIILLIGVMSAIIGFLFYNWHPAKMFMGDTGSQFLGLFLAAIGIIYFWNAPDTQGNLIASKQILVTILTFAIPIIDTTSVVINRILKGQSPFIGGKDHTTHCLFFSGYTERGIAILYAFICFISMFFNHLILHHFPNWGYIHIFIFSSYFILLFWFLYTPTIKYGR